MLRTFILKNIQANCGKTQVHPVMRDECSWAGLSSTWTAGSQHLTFCVTTVIKRFQSTYALIFCPIADSIEPLSQQTHMGVRMKSFLKAEGPEESVYLNLTKENNTAPLHCFITGGKVALVFNLRLSMFRSVVRTSFLNTSWIFNQLSRMLQQPFHFLFI